MSSYEKPSVRVIQEIVRESPTSASVPLLATIVGPLKAIRSFADYGSNLVVGHYLSETITFEDVFKLRYPGMEVYPDKIKVLATGSFSLFASEDTFLMSSGDYTLVDSINMDDPQVLKASVGDTIILTRDAETIKTRIIDITVAEDGISFKLATVIMNAGGYSYEIVKNMERVDITSSLLVDINIDDEELSITTGATANTEFGTLLMKDAYILVEYEALRRDKDSEVMFVSNIDQLRSMVDIIDERNPLGYAASIAIQVTGGVEVALVSADDTEAGHMKAISTIKSFSSVRTDLYLYYLSVLTDTTAYFDLYKAMVQEGEDMNKVRYHTLHVYTNVPDTVAVYDDPDATSELIADATSNPCIFRDLGGSFMAAGINPGMKIIGLRGEVEVELVVEEVINDNLIKISGAAALGAFDSYTIVKELDTESKQAEYVKQVSEGYAHRRIVNIFPARHRYAGELIDAKYGPVKVAALSSMFPPQVGFTNMDMPLMGSVVFPGGFQWSDEALNVAASGGTMLLVNIGAETVLCRHQLTTDRSDVKTQEYSITKTFDYCTLQFKSVLDPYIGKWNMIADLMASMRASIASTEEQIKAEHIDRYGAPLIEVLDKKIAENPDKLDGSLVEMTFRIPTPHNDCLMRVRI